MSLTRTSDDMRCQVCSSISMIEIGILSFLMFSNNFWIKNLTVEWMKFQADIQDIHHVGGKNRKSSLSDTEKISMTYWKG